MLLRTIAFCCFFGISITQAQQFGGHPVSTRWKQINTDSVRVIFPDGWQQQAAAVTSTIHRLGHQQPAPLGSGFHKINIVLQPKTTLSNGYVAMGPWRSEFMLTPPQNSFDLGSLPWQYTLSLHEYRHVQQYNNFRKGIAKVFYYLFGEQGQELLNNAAVPNWFWEGDAVYQETMLSEQGRGRLPGFFNGYRSLWYGNKKYSWMKLRNGSLRDYVPDHYQLGYMLVAYGREIYGADIWGKVTADAAAFKGLFYPFQKAVRKYTNEDYNSFTHNAGNYFRTRPEEMTGYTGTSGSSAIDKQVQATKHFTGNEEYPQWIDDHTLILVRNSYKKIPAFYLQDVMTGKRKQLRVKDISLDNYFSYRNGRVVYAAFEPDLRWGWRDYGVIKWLDVKSNQQHTLTHHTHYFSPDISNDGSQIVAVQVIPGTKPELHLLNASDGSVIRKIPNPDSVFYTYPKFYDAQQVVTPVRRNTGEMALALVNTNTGVTEYLTPFSMNVIGFPSVHKDTIGFTASYREQDRMFLLIQKQLYLFIPPEAASKTGQYQLAVANNRFAWSNFTAVGQRLLHGELKKEQLKPVEIASLSRPPGVFNVRAMNGGKNIPVEQSSTVSYPVKKYSGAKGLLNFHSWRPYISDPEYSFSVLGENVLNTMQSELYFTYNRNEKFKQVGASFAYGGLFPWLRMGTNYTFDRRAYTTGGQAVYWNEWEGSAGAVVPLNFSAGRHNRYLTLSSDFVYNKRYYQEPYKNVFDSRGFGYLSSGLTFSNQNQRARQHIYPRWAQSITLNYWRAITLFEGSNQFLANGYWYLPGLAQSHNLVLNTAFHQRDTLGDVFFSNRFPYSRGYSARNFHRMFKLGANYHLPLLYPDWGFANMVYFTRVRANLYYDYTHRMDYTTTRQQSKAEYRSYGTEIYFDTKWWNQYNISFGVRYSRLIDGELQGLSANQWEIILPVNLLGR